MADTPRGGLQKDAIEAGMVDSLTKTMNKALRAILPVWRTFPTKALYRETGIPPAELYLETIRYRHAARIKRLDAQHPLARRSKIEMKPPIPPALSLIKAVYLRHRGYSTSGTPEPKHEMTRLQKANALLPEPTYRPTLIRKHQPSALSPPLDIDRADKKTAAANFLDWYEDLPPDTVVAFSDGSRTDKGTGWGYVVTRNQGIIKEGWGTIPKGEVFDAEAVGAMEALKASLEIQAPQYYVCLDNQAVLQCLGGQPSDPSQDALEFRRLAQSNTVSAKWSPGHTDIPGNEAADKLAKTGADAALAIQSATATIAYIKRIAKDTSKQAFERW